MEKVLISIQVEKELIKNFKKFCKKKGYSVSGIIRVMIAEKLRSETKIKGVCKV